VRRTVLLVGAWLVCGAAAVVAASVGVSRVGDRVTDDRPTPLSAAEVRDELASAAIVSTTTTTPPATSPPAASTTTTGTSAPTVSEPPPPPATAELSETRTYALVGGTATLRFAPSGVTVVAAAPNPGFSVETSPEHGNGIRVEFDSDEHRSRVTGWWEDGPREEVREED
jgi:hypothetical protein